MGRATQGVRLINLKGDDVIAAVSQVPRDEDEEAIDISDIDVDIETDVELDVESIETPETEPEK
jgi:DNA gyrase subunit A